MKCNVNVEVQEGCEPIERHKHHMPYKIEVMLDVMEFSLDYAIVRMPDGRLLRQTQGIPMGDPVSPAMMLSACAWMENEWSEALAPADKQFFRAKRFMDDILLAYVETPRWDAGRFVEDMQRSVVYQEPLKLERGHDGTFLETRTSFDVTQTQE